MSRRKHRPRPSGDPYAEGVPAGYARCLRCLWPFASANPISNRICPACADQNRDLSRTQLRESSGGAKVHIDYR